MKEPPQYFTTRDYLLCSAGRIIRSWERDDLSIEFEDCRVREPSGYITSGVEGGLRYQEGEPIGRHSRVSTTIADRTTSEVSQANCDLTNCEMTMGHKDALAENVLMEQFLYLSYQ